MDEVCNAICPYALYNLCASPKIQLYLHLFERVEIAPVRVVETLLGRSGCGLFGRL